MTLESYSYRSVQRIELKEKTEQFSEWQNKNSSQLKTESRGGSDSSPVIRINLLQRREREVETGMGNMVLQL